MFSLLLRCAADRDELIADLWEAGTDGVVEEDAGLRAFFSDDAARHGLRDVLMARFAASTPEWRDEPIGDWEQTTRDAWPPLLIGEKFFLVAPWSDEPAPVGRLRLVIEPGMACGTGRHPCTQLCLEALERHVKPGDAVLDVGTGSGILSAAAALLGAVRVVACDIDEDSVAIARGRIGESVFVGSADAVRGACADVIVANISSAVVEELAPEFARIRARGSTLILSGFEEWDLPEGFDPRETLMREGWVCFVC